MLLALLLMTLAAGARLTAGVVDLLWQPPPSGASDLAKRHFEVELWFSGEFDYDEMRGVKYPPASYVLFWPLLGWLPFQASRWLWAGLTALALVWLALVTMRESGSKSWIERAFVVLMLLSISATGVSISTGQPSIMLLSFPIGGTFLLQRGCPSWRLSCFRLNS